MASRGSSALEAPGEALDRAPRARAGVVVVRGASSCAGGADLSNGHYVAGPLLEGVMVRGLGDSCSREAAISVQEDMTGVRVAFHDSRLL